MADYRQHPRVIVVGAGIGGLTTAALLAKAGYDVRVLEAQTYPGGSASTFFHKGYRFESGATVAGGFQPFGPHAVVGDLLGIDWPVRLHEPAWVVHLPDRRVGLTRDNHDVLAHFADTAPFWKEQSRVADMAWRLSSEGLPWPPRDLAEVMSLARAGLKYFPRDLMLAPYALTTVLQWLKRMRMATQREFVRFIDSTLLISAQTTSAYVNALYGATAMDLARQGVYHVQGGIGGIAEALVANLKSWGGDIQYRSFVRQIVVEGNRVTGVLVQNGRRTKRTEFIPADFVVANATPWSLDGLLGEASPRSLRAEVARRSETQGAFVLHLGVAADALPPDLPDHHQIVRTYNGPMGEGDTVFVSLSPEWDASRAPGGMRAVTVSTHTRVAPWWVALAESEAGYYERKQQYAEKMIDLIETAIPGFRSGVRLVLPGSPVTYEFYTLRQRGMVGGFPQTSLFRMRGPRTGLPNVRLVGDSIFPGQSTAGVSLGGLRVARDVMRHLPLPNPVIRALPASARKAQHER